MNRSQKILEVLFPWAENDPIVDTEEFMEILKELVRKYDLPVVVKEVTATADGEEVKVVFASEEAEKSFKLSYDSTGPVMIFPDGQDELVVSIGDLAPSFETHPDWGKWELAGVDAPDEEKAFYLFLSGADMWISRDVMQTILITLGLLGDEHLEVEPEKLDAFGNKIIEGLEDANEEAFKKKWVVRGGKKVQKKFRVRKKILKSSEKQARKRGAKIAARKRKAKMGAILRKRKVSNRVRKKSIR